VIRGIQFDFLGYTFQPRRSKNRKGKFFINFSLAVSNKAAKTIRDTFRRWNLPNRSDKAIEDLSRMFNPISRGWLQYYGRYYRSALYPTMVNWTEIWSFGPLIERHPRLSKLASDRY
jgi:RNA-directed DNA polymerase